MIDWIQLVASWTWQNSLEIWLVGTLSVLAFALIQQVRTRCRISQLPEPFDERLHELFLECLASSGLENSHLRLAESPRPGDIAVYGFLRASRLIVPADLLKIIPKTKCAESSFTSWPT